MKSFFQSHFLLKFKIFMFQTIQHRNQTFICRFVFIHYLQLLLLYFKQYLQRLGDVITAIKLENDLVYPFCFLFFGRIKRQKLTNSIFFYLFFHVLQLLQPIDAECELDVFLKDGVASMIFTFDHLEKVHAGLCPLHQFISFD